MENKWHHTWTIFEACSILNIQIDLIKYRENDEGILSLIAFCSIYNILVNGKLVLKVQTLQLVRGVHLSGNVLLFSHMNDQVQVVLCLFGFKDFTPKAKNSPLNTIRTMVLQQPIYSFTYPRTLSPTRALCLVWKNGKKMPLHLSEFPNLCK